MSHCQLVSCFYTTVIVTFKIKVYVNADYKTGISLALYICMNAVQIIKQTDTTDGKPRWDVLVNGEWDSSWDRASDAKARASNLKGN